MSNVCDFGVLYNNEYGGFRLSEKAKKIYEKIPGIKGIKKHSLNNLNLLEFRKDQNMVEVVKQLGEAASGEKSEIRIKMIPNRFKSYVTIQEYDGKEDVQIEFERYQVHIITGLSKRLSNILKNRDALDVDAIESISQSISKVLEEKDINKKISDYNRDEPDNTDQEGSINERREQIAEEIKKIEQAEQEQKEREEKERQVEAEKQRIIYAEKQRQRKEDSARIEREANARREEMERVAREGREANARIAEAEREYREERSTRGHQTRDLNPYSRVFTPDNAGQQQASSRKSHHTRVFTPDSARQQQARSGNSHHNSQSWGSWKKKSTDEAWQEYERQRKIAEANGKPFR
jgi:hypothetical protein